MRRASSRSMSTEHTPEPWTVKDTAIIAGKQGMHLVREAPGMSVVGPANARRIVACINACAGIPTEVLERNGIRHLMDAVNALLRENHSQVVSQFNAAPEARDALAKLCRDYRETESL